MEYFNMRDLFPKSKLKENAEAAEIFEVIAQETDGKIPKDIAEMLLRENRDPNYIIRIHRCLADKKEEIFTDGLRIKGGTNLDYTTSDYTGSDMTLMISVRDAHAYKNPRDEDALCVITKIPKSYLEYQKGITKPILFPTQDAAEQSGGFITMQNGVQTILLPEFVLGAVEFSNGRITGFASNEKYKNEHDYLGDGLVFPDSVISDYYEKTKTPRVTEGMESWDLQDKQDSKIAQIIIQEGNEYELARKNGARTENEIKEFSLKEMPKSKFKMFFEKIKDFFKGKDTSKDKIGEEFDDRH